MEEDLRAHEQIRVLEAALVLPPPYGHVVWWRLLFGFRWYEIRGLLEAHRPDGSGPVCNRSAQAFVTKGMEMLVDWLVGVEPRVAHPQRYMRKKNRWIDSTLPPLPSPSGWRRAAPEE